MKKTPDEVKTFVTKYFKAQRWTQKEAGQMTGYGRQAVANLLANHEYFTEKQAILFSLAFGFNKEFLMHGIGEPFMPWKDNPLSVPIISFIKNYVCKKIEFCQELSKNASMLSRLDRSINPEALENMENAFKEILDFLNVEFKCLYDEKDS